MKKIGNPYVYTIQENRTINQLRPFNGDTWNRARSIRGQVTEHLKNEQNNECAYCDLPLEETSRVEIDHIAALRVDANRYPEFTFEAQNLALSCSLCNGSSRKGSKNTIENYDPVYTNCSFTIVHPYFDNPTEHLGYLDDQDGVVIKGLTPKGTETIKMFELATEARTVARKAKQFRGNFNRVRQAHPVLGNLIERAINFLAD